ncbi:MAG: glycerol-3-phosphate dehydrogenase [Psychromonas sp.]
MSVGLYDAADFASATSSASSKLGLYLSAEQQAKVAAYIDEKVQKEVALKFSLTG